MEFVLKRKFADRHGTDGEQALAGGTKVVWACSAGLSAKIKLMTMLHLETCSMQPVGWRKAEPSMAIPVVHIAPPGTNAGMPEWWLGGCLCINWQKDG